MNPTRALKRIRDLARNGDYVITAYCAARMWQRSISRVDVVAVLTRSRRCFAQENGRWKLEGVDMSGDPLVVIVEIQDGVVVVTVYGGDEDEG